MFFVCYVFACLSVFVCLFVFVVFRLHIYVYGLSFLCLVFVFVLVCWFKVLLSFCASVALYRFLMWLFSCCVCLFLVVFACVGGVVPVFCVMHVCL